MKKGRRLLSRFSEKYVVERVKVFARPVYLQYHETFGQPERTGELVGFIVGVGFDSEGAYRVIAETHDQAVAEQIAVSVKKALRLVAGHRFPENEGETS